MKKALLFLLAGILLAACSGAATPPTAVFTPTMAPTNTAPPPTPTPRITHVYAFGDDFTDTGNCLKLFKEAVDKGQMVESDLDMLEEGWEGRLTNGPVAVEVMAERLKVGLTNYAVCAAKSGQDSIQFFDTGLLGQIDKFEAELKGEKADSDALYFIEIGIVDFYLTAAWIDNDVIANIATAVTRLAKLGAKHVMVGNSLDLNNYPGFKRESMTSEAEKFYTSMNTKLPGEMEKLAQELNIQVEIFDLAAVAEQIQSNPDQYGLTQLESTCTDHPYSSGGVCENPDEYYYWGYYYLSRVVHQALGEAMAEQLSK